jgi:hypothetical protein
MPRIISSIVAETQRKAGGTAILLFARAAKNPAPPPGFRFARKELPCFDLSIWRRPDAIAKIGKAEARGARFGHIALWLIAAIGLMMLLR